MTSVAEAVVAYLRERAADPEVVRACAEDADVHEADARQTLDTFLRIVGDES